MRNDTKLFQSTPPVKAATFDYFSIVPPYGFQSTPPVKAATLSEVRYKQEDVISIHAAREGGDAIEYIVVGWVGDFNPRRP